MQESRTRHLVKFIREISEKRKQVKANRPYHINVIKSAASGKMKETAHSMILADLLRHPKIQKRFLERFLDIKEDITFKIKIELGDGESRIDIVLYDPTHFIIIENKANWAPEQPEQVYRYVEYIARRNYSYEQIYVLYLNPMSTNLPSDDSLKGIQDKLDNRFRVVSMAHDICKWLIDERSIIENDKKSEPYLQSALTQYIDYLNLLYNPFKQTLSVMPELQEQLCHEFNLDAMSGAQLLERLDENLEAIAIINDGLSKMREIELKNWLNGLIAELAVKFNADIIEWFCGSSKDNVFESCNKRWPKAGLYVKYHDIMINVLIQYSLDSGIVEYGIRKKMIGEENQFLEQELKEICGASNYGDKNWWYFVKRSTYKDVKEEVIDLINGLLSPVKK